MPERDIMGKMLEELMDFFRIYARRDLYEKAREIVETCGREGETVSMFEMFEQVEARAFQNSERIS